MKQSSKYMEILPYKLKKRINKTGEGRSGLEIYKRRNRRNYRVIIQYITWLNIIKSDPLFLNNFEEGYVILASPEEYFGKSYPNKSPNMHNNFILGKNGFIYYSSINQYKHYTPLEDWREVYELSTVGSIKEITWCGEYVKNIKNSKPPHISDICYNAKNKKDKEEKINRVSTYISENFDDILNIDSNYPEQSGLGNYDYDYANIEMINNVKLQMLYLMLNCSNDGETFAKFIVDNLDNIKDKQDTSTFLKLVENKDNYIKLFKDNLKNLEAECIRLGLLDKQLLNNNSIFNENLNKTICPLCCKVIEPKDFFTEIIQQEGRQVKDNTQREIVLMHINALKPGTLNHKVYNLGWGHNFCNAIQGDKDIAQTIDLLEEIIENHKIYR